MSRSSRANPSDLQRRLPLAIGLLVALVSAPQVWATEITAAPTSEEAAHHCKCGTKCRGKSCCCAPRKRAATAAAPAPERSVGRDQAESNPCSVSGAPCSVPGLPTSAPSGPESKNAAIASLMCLTRLKVGVLLTESTDTGSPLRRASRLDRPPDHNRG